MLFARCRKQDNRERNNDDALANEGRHNALAQLSVSAAVCKDESVMVGRDRRDAPLEHSVTITTTSKSKSESEKQRKSYD